ncbi:MAG: hypothetical protein Q4C15_02675 [Eubacteriales bacterium]|jgi:hypothetical protein|nr:hypothetical protein [Oscillospiraceae bacterium]MDO4420931.1 hypothetical protein [Eubacteriales bacterium]
MIEFNCTVKDIFRRPNMIDKAVRKLADNGYAEYAVIYARIRDNIYNALAYAAKNMKDYEYKVAVAYLESRSSEQTVAKETYYTHRTIRRYVRKACEFVRRYYEEKLGIKLLPIDTKTIRSTVCAGTFWEKVDSLMKSSIENACIVILRCNEHVSVNYVCSNYGMGSGKVKKIVDDFGAVITAYDIPSEKRSAV